MIKDVYRIVAFDLAKGNAGWSCVEYSIKNNKFTIIKTGSITSSSVAGKVAFRDEVNLYGKDVITFQVLSKEVHRIIKNNNPDFVSAEDAFYRQHLSAYTSLILCLHCVAVVAKEFGHMLYKIISTKAKLCLTSHGHCKKATTIDTIKEHPGIVFNNEDDKIDLDEHQADSIAIAYTFCIQLLPGIIAEKNK